MGLYEDAVVAFASGATGPAEDLALGLLSQALDDGDAAILMAGQNRLQYRLLQMGAS